MSARCQCVGVCVCMCVRESITETVRPIKMVSLPAGWIASASRRERERAKESARQAGLATTRQQQ